MSKPELDDILIHKYIKGTLNNDEMKMFREESKRKDFRKKLLKNISVLKNINDSNKEALLNKIEYLKLTQFDEEPIKSEKFETEVSSEIKLKTKARNTKLMAYVFIIFAIVSAFLSWYYFNSNNTKDVRQYAELFIESESTLGMYGETSRGSEVKEIKEKRIQFQNKVGGLVEAQNHSELIKAFASAEQNLDLSLTEKYIWASSLVKQGNSDKAIDLLNEIVDVQGEFFIESLWLRGLCYATNDQIDLMRKDLHEIKSLSQYRKKQIDQLLSSIQK